MGSRVGQVVNRLKSTFSCASGNKYQTPRRYVLVFHVFVRFLFVVVAVLKSLEVRKQDLKSPWPPFLKGAKLSLHEILCLI